MTAAPDQRPDDALILSLRAVIDSMLQKHATYLNAKVPREDGPSVEARDFDHARGAVERAVEQAVSAISEQCAADLERFTACLKAANDRAAAAEAEVQRLRAVLRDLVQWLDDHDWGYVPEPGESHIPFRAALRPSSEGDKDV